MRILLIAGGWSSEREVSLKGAQGIAKTLEERGYAVTFFDLQQGFDNLIQTASQHDFAFINLHGAPGEDGLVQAMLDTCGCPYQGSGARGSFLALHKAAAKQVLRSKGVPTPDWEFLHAMPETTYQPCLPYPLFVKSNTGGSSLLLGRVQNATELFALLQEIFAAGSEVIIEPVIEGQDVTCGVLGDTALPPVLILPQAGEFFDFASKYQQGGAKEICPAPLPQHIIEQVQKLAVTAHTILGLSGYSRTDFRLTADEKLYVLEVNTLPGMTPTSLVPQEAQAAGMNFGDLLEHLISLGMQKNKAPLA